MCFTPEKLDALKEIFNIGIGRAAANLSELLEEHIELKVPSLVPLQNKSDLLDYLHGKFCELPLASVKMAFEGPLRGQSLLLFSNEGAIRIVNELSEEEVSSLDAVSSGVLTEVGNIVCNGLIGEFVNQLEVQDRLKCSIPTYSELQSEEHLDLADLYVLVIEVDFRTSHLDVSGAIIFCVGVESLDFLDHALARVLDDV